MAGAAVASDQILSSILQDRRRILVIGSGGAGKSTFARELAARAGLPLIHLDRHYWKPGWIPTPTEEWISTVQRLSSADSWIMDGNYGGSLSIRVQRCDAIVFFDMPRLVCLKGVLLRWVMRRLQPRPDLPEGCHEKLNWEFLRWIWNFHRSSRPRVLAVLKQVQPDVPVLTITSRAQARAVLNSISRPAS